MSTQAFTDEAAELIRRARHDAVRAVIRLIDHDLTMGEAFGCDKRFSEETFADLRRVREELKAFRASATPSVPVEALSLPCPQFDVIAFAARIAPDAKLSAIADAVEEQGFEWRFKVQPIPDDSDSRATPQGEPQ